MEVDFFSAAADVSDSNLLPRACRALFDHHAFDVFLTGKLQNVIDEFAALDDPQERLGMLVDRAKKRPPFPDSDRTEANRVRGCVSVVWLAGDVRAGRCYFRSDAESPVVRGLLAFVCDFFSDTPVAEVATCAVDPLEALGVTRNLTPTRRHGLDAARRAIQAFARSHMVAEGHT